MATRQRLIGRMSESFANSEAVMRHALELAREGIGDVEPNPPVGAVIVDENLQNLGEGYHRRFGGPHAEIHALDTAGDAARGAELYVTLEPCSHTGKTPPCTDAIIRAGIKKVVVGTRDPAPHADGAGLDRLRKAGIDVEVGRLEKDAQALIAAFTKWVTTGRPYVHAKWAMSWDGRIATRTGESQWISNTESRQLVHEVRGRMDAILIGIGTALTDNPLLTTRPPGRRTATRVIVDSHARLPIDSKLVQTVSDAPVLVVSGPGAASENVDQLRQAGVEVLVLAEEAEGRPSLSTLMNELGSRDMTNVLAEGGTALLGSLFDHGLVDMVHVFIGPLIIGSVESVSPVGGIGCGSLDGAWTIADPDIRRVGDDFYMTGRAKASAIRSGMS